MKDKQPKTRSEWIALVKEQATSGLSQLKFCRQKGLIACRFSYYRKHYGEVDGYSDKKISLCTGINVTVRTVTIKLIE